MKKKLVAFVLMLSLVVTGLMVSPAKEVQAAAKWKKAYEKKVKSYEGANDKVEYATVKIKGIKQPVLLVLHTDLYKECMNAYVFKYTNGKVKRIWIKQPGLSAGPFFKKREKVLLRVGYGDGEDYYVLNVKKGKIKADVYTQFLDVDKAGNPCAGYLKNKKSCSKKTFNKAIKGAKEIKMK